MLLVSACGKKNEEVRLLPSADLLQNTIWKGVKELYSADGKKIEKSIDVEFIFYSMDKGRYKGINETVFKDGNATNYMYDFDYTVDKNLLTVSRGYNIDKYVITEFTGKQMKLQFTDYKNSIITLQKQN